MTRRDATGRDGTGRGTSSGTYLGQRLVRAEAGVVDTADVVGPGPDGADVETERLLVGGGGEREGVVLSGGQLQAGDAHPLARLVLEVQRLLKHQLRHAWE